MPQAALLAGMVQSPASSGPPGVEELCRHPRISQRAQCVGVAPIPSARIASRTATSLTPGLPRFDFTQDDPQVGEVDLAVGAGFVGLT